MSNEVLKIFDVHLPSPRGVNPLEIWLLTIGLRGNLALQVCRVDRTPSYKPLSPPQGVKLLETKRLWEQQATCITLTLPHRS